jgi:hypothetical protein
MSGIKMSDCRFYVDEDARTIICVIADTKDFIVRDAVIDFLDEQFRYNDFDVNLAVCYSSLRDDLKMPRSFMGKAVCSEDDEWDEEAGKLLAFKRAKTKFYNSFFKRANILMRALDRRLDDMVKTFGQLGIKIEDNMNAIDQQLGDRDILIPEDEM